MTDGTVDAITLSVISGRMNRIANEMDKILVRSAFSPIVSEANDMTNGFFRVDGRTIVQGDYGLPIFAGNMAHTVRSVSDEFAEDLHEGDIFITNDPYIGGTHLNDVKLIKPIFVEGDHVMFIGTTAHWQDVGGAVSGGRSPQTTEITQEGIRIPILKLEESGSRITQLPDLIFANARQSESTEGDFKAQLNALYTGENRLKDLFDEYGKNTILNSIEELESRSEKIIRSKLEEIDNNIYTYTDYMDNDGISDEPLKINLELEVDGSDICMDFSGTASACAGPYNIPKSSTVSACHLTFQHIFPDIPNNAGCYAPFNINIPVGSILHAEYPYAVNVYTETSQRVVDVVIGALGQAIPNKVPAQSFSVSGGLQAGGRTKEHGEYVWLYSMAGGYGATYDIDGANHCTPPYARARMPSVEVMEMQYPVRFHKKMLRADSGGPGRRRGGLGTIYDIEILDDEVSVTSTADRSKFPPSGIAEGKDALGMETKIIKDQNEYVPPLNPKFQITLSRGDRIIRKSPGGGGHGLPSEREADRIIADLNSGYITPEHASEAYGIDVSLTNDGYEIQ